MQLDHVTWQGPPVDDDATLDRLPECLRGLLLQINGFIQFSGGFHLRGASYKPEWHSLRHAWDSEDAFHRHYVTVQESDIPFAEDALGDQYFLRDERVVKLCSESDEIDSIGIGLYDFLESVQRDPMGVLAFAAATEPLGSGWAP